MSRQPDLFQPEDQTTHSGGENTPVYKPDPERVRARLLKIIAEARAANVIPWDASRVSLYRTIVPQMSLLLPEEEGAQLRFEFETELARLEAA